MKFASILLLTGIAALAGCSTTANNGNANMRGTNTNTGYMTNSDTNVKPTMPSNVTNLTPGGGSSTGNSSMNSSSMSNANSRTMNANANRKPGTDKMKP